MVPAEPTQFTRTLGKFESGDEAAAGELLPLVYDELRALAGLPMKAERADHKRDRSAIKRGGPDRVLVALDEALTQVEHGVVDVLVMNEALERLALRSERQARLVELRFFGDLTMEESAEVPGISLTTAKADWTIARAWLGRELSDSSTS